MYEDDDLTSDDEVVMEDVISLIGAFIDRSINDRFFNEPPEPVPPAVVQRKKPVTAGRLCFVITRNKSSSWAEDLSEMGSLEKRTRVYN